MGLARKSSRSITVGETAYRRVVSVHAGYLGLIVERRDDPGQRLIAWLHHHDCYSRDAAGRWHCVGQLRSVTPALVRGSVLMALDKGWQPDKKGAGTFDLWDAEDRFPVSPPADERGVRLKEVARKIVGDLRFDVSVDLEWRRRLLNAEPGKRFEVHHLNGHGLRFAAFFDGWTPDGMWVIGIECSDFPDVVDCTTNGRGFL